MKFKQQAVIEFESFQESKAFRKWSKLNIGKHRDQHIAQLCDDQAISLTAHGEQMMRQWASLQEQEA